MPAPFKQISIEQFAELLSRYPFTRKINAVHMHHTWRPNRAQYRGHDTIVAMWRFHTETNHWSDIAQHISIAPDGSIWLGRDWNRAPASASGHNGNAQAGPFMFEMIGDFDEGRDPFDGPQRATALEVIARVQQRFGLPTGTLQLHNMMSTKSCPGTSIDYQEVLHDVDQLRLQLMSGTRSSRAPDGPFAQDQLEIQQVVREAIDDLQRGASRAVDPFDAEPCNHGPGHNQAPRQAGQRSSIRFDAADLAAMRPHIVNLRMGQFSDKGDWTTAPHDVDAIFDDYLPAALTAARAEGRPLRVMFYAHGGLTGEADALAAAHARIGWWKSNGIYPIHFIWETGLGEVLGQMLDRWQQGREVVSRNLFSDHVSDPLIEAFAHRAGGVQIWNSMKWSAQQSSSERQPTGGAFYVAEQLAAFCQANPDDVEIHAAGHSAGAIFHSHFIPCALARGVPRFDSLHLLAPAVRVDLFRENLYSRIGPRQGVEKLTVYTMADSFEKEDNCGKVYRKSLLYLIYKGLEPELDEPVLGLERCLRTDPDMKRLFGLAGGDKIAEVIWSDNGQERGRSASRSRTHGGFDDDPATMGSIVRRVLGKRDADRIVELPAAARGIGVDPWRVPVDEWDDMPGTGWTEPVAPPQQIWTPMPSTFSAPPAGGRRLALCVGIDAYPNNPLQGCVNDAEAWADTLVHLGFEAPRMLLDREATAANMRREMTALLTNSRAGDVIVIQYSGHGTNIVDVDGDETDGYDEAMCPVDFDDGELIVDDEIRAIFAQLPDGVNLTCFFDCCFSGTISRMAYGARPVPLAAGKRARFVIASPRVVEKYLAKRQRGSRGIAAASGGEMASMREIVFSACLATEVALESDGSGDFTRYALQVLQQQGTGLSNREFARRVTQAFGPAPQQHADLYSSDGGQALALLQPLQAQQGGRSASSRGPRAHQPEQRKRERREAAHVY